MNIKTIIVKGESETAEFKKSTGESKEIIKTISAFSNTKGGNIIIGISKSGKISGIKVGKDTLERLTNQIFQNTDPKAHPRIIIRKVKDKALVLIEIKESSDHLSLAFGRPYKRVGKSTVKMSKDEYERLILEKHKGKLYFDSQICQNASLKEIGGEKVEWFVKEARRQRGLDIDESLSTGEILERLKFIKNKRLTNAAVLLFSKNPQQLFLQTVIKAIRFKGIDVTEDMLDFKTIEGDLLNQLKKAEDFIFEHIPKQAWIEEGKLQRQEKWLYPPKVIREALANALAHRNYKTTSSIQVRIFNDRLEIWNPGCLPSGLTIEKLKAKHDSIPRNPLIARAFFWVKYVEEVGTGTNKIIKWCKEWKLSEPEFEETGTSFVVTLRRSKLTEKYLFSLKLNKRQKRAIEYLREYKHITNREYRKINEIGKVVSAKELNFMVEKNILRRIGEGRNTRYELND
jgi:ATP-dependent DNA helicase RecG